MLATKTKIVSGSAAAVIAMATAFIAPWEGKVNTTYLDTIASPPILTVCYGHTGKYAIKGATYSDDMCKKILAADVEKHYAGLAACVSVNHVPVSVQASLLELFFNVGVGAGCASTMTAKANLGRYTEACDQLDRWVKAGGKTIRGLVNRRNASKEMCVIDIK